MAHESVLLQEVIAGFKVQPGETIVDLTLNRGGHSRALCDGVAAHGRLIGIDADSQALPEATENLRSCPCPVTVLQGNFRHLATLLDGAGIGKVDVILADLGLSSEQLAASGRGFSFQTDEPLLMTLAREAAPGALTAHEVVNFWQEETLADVIYAYGEERYARRIAKTIVTERQKQPIETTSALVAIIKEAVPISYIRGRRHFATKTFQALRIVVNNELGTLSDTLPLAWSRLNLGGRLGIITFHGLEARVVKKFFRERIQASEGELLTKRAIRPTRAEVLQNPRSRSAQLRIIKKKI